MKKLIFPILALSLVIFSCKRDDHENGNACSSIGAYQDTVVAGNYKLFLIALANSTGASVEVVDKNNNNLTSSGISINLVQLQNGNDCWQTNAINSGITSDANVYGGIYNGAPSWAYSNSTTAIIKLTISANTYYLRDPHVNN